MAVLAVLVATVALLGHRTHIEQVIAQSKASDQWAYYQAKGVVVTTTRLFLSCWPRSPPRTKPKKSKLGRNF